MTKMSESRKAKKGLVETPIKRRDLTKTELKEFIKMTDLVNSEIWKAMQVAGNTALIPSGKGKELAEQMEAKARLYENAKNNWISSILGQCGITQGVRCAINAETGVITENAEVKEAEKPKIAKEVKK